MKPLNGKNYGSIPHLLESKLGIGDYHIHEGQDKILTQKIRDKNDIIIVTEKYDGSNVGVCRADGNIHAITRSGYLATTSQYQQHQYFAIWVEKNKNKFSFLQDGERIAGEWMLQSCSLLYKIENKNVFIAFDIFKDNKRQPYNLLDAVCSHNDIQIARLLHKGGSISVEESMRLVSLDHKHDIKTEKPEGVVYRCERNGEVDFLAKYVRHDFEPGKNLFGDAVYNIAPDLIF